MVAKASIIEIYAKADAAGRVDIICKNYSNFIGIVDGYTDGIRYMIESEKAYNRKKNHGDLGVRVQTSGIHSDITADTAISNVITRDAIIACDFSGDISLVFRDEFGLKLTFPILCEVLCGRTSHESYSRGSY